MVNQSAAAAVPVSDFHKLRKRANSQDDYQFAYNGGHDAQQSLYAAQHQIDTGAQAAMVHSANVSPVGFNMGNDFDPRGRHSVMNMHGISSSFNMASMQ